MDRLTPQKRSALMSRVKRADTQPELQVRKLLYGLGLRFRVHAKELPGKPDIVNRKKRFAVFVHGCFWHGHSCKRGKRPTSNPGFWEAKLSRNVERDAANVEALRRDGWTVLTVWECQLKVPRKVEALLRAKLS